MGFFWRNLEEALRLWKAYRSAIHSRIAWLVVFAGAAVMATPAWLPIATELLRQNTNLNVSGLDAVAAGAEPKFGLIAIALGLSYHAWSVWHVAQASAAACTKVVSHDHAILSQLMGLLDEQTLDEFFPRMLGDHSYYEPDIDVLRRGVDHIRRISNRYLDGELNEAVRNLRARLDELVRFLEVDFDFYPPTQNYPRGNRYCMRPHWNIDRAGHGGPDEDRMYDECVRQLHDLCNGVIRQYGNVVLMAKAKHN
jgi:hypothetical protein